MLKNYIKIAHRHLLKNKAFSLINILGLTIGMTSCLLILQYVSFEMSYDKFHEKVDRIYRIQHNRYKNNELEYRKAQTFVAQGPAMKREFAEVEHYARLWPVTTHAPFVIGIEDESGNVTKHDESNVYQVDPSLLNIFSFNMLQGDSTALKAPGSMIISVSTAEKYFGDQWQEKALGSILTADWFKKKPFIITGVFEDIPENTHIYFDILYSWEPVSDDDENNWGWDGFFTYLLLSPEADAKALEAKLPAFADQYVNKNMHDEGLTSQFELQPLKNIHLYSDLLGEAEANGNVNSVYFLALIAVIILILAWINFVNLSTAKSTERAREVGVRKVTGSGKGQLILRFMLESAYINTIALMLALTLWQLLLPYFYILTGKQVNFDLFQYNLFPAVLLAALLVSIIISGSYPAFMLSSYQPIKVLKSQIMHTSPGFSLRKVLVVFQFTVAVFLLIGIFTIFHQVHFMRHQDLGINIAESLVIKTQELPNSRKDDSLYQIKADVFRTEILREVSIQGATFTSSIPGRENEWLVEGRVSRAGEDIKQGKSYYFIRADHGYIPTFGLKLLAGRNFESGFGTDKKAVIINKTSARQLGFEKPADAVGEAIYAFGKRTIIGVIDDYHSQSLKEHIEPILFIKEPGPVNYAIINLQTKNITSAITSIEHQWLTIFPEKPFNYFFLDHYFDQQYRADQQFEVTFGTFSGLALFIACLGLFSLVSYTTVQRTKEIGIRKLLGASVKSIFKLLCQDFVKLILIASLLALPMAYFVMQQWLENYAFRINMSWWLLATPVAMAVLIALITISFQTFKAALANPVDSLRHE